MRVTGHAHIRDCDNMSFESSKLRQGAARLTYTHVSEVQRTRRTSYTSAIQKKRDPLKEGKGTYLLWFVVRTHSRINSRWLILDSDGVVSEFVVHALVVCSVLLVPSRRGRGRVVHFLLDTSPMSTKTARRDDTDRHTSDVSALPLVRKYTFQSTRTNVAHATVVAKLAVPVWSAVGVLGNHFGSAGTLFVGHGYRFAIIRKSVNPSGVGTNGVQPTSRATIAIEQVKEVGWRRFPFMEQLKKGSRYGTVHSGPKT